MAKKQASKKTANKSKQNEFSNTELAGIGIGITAAAAAAAGAFFLYGSKNAKKNRAKVKSWTLKAKAEALEALERAENMTREEYEQMIDRIGSAYAVVKEASKADIADFKKEMKSYWKNIATEAGGTVKRATKSSAKKMAKKTVANAKKAAKKQK
ncbi:MAG: hypothetical protein WDZ93_00070 [Candidatus Paceibacterota bacterium]